MPPRLPRNADFAIVGAFAVVTLVTDLIGGLSLIDAIWRAAWVALVAVAGREADRRSFPILAVFALALGAGFGLVAAVLCLAGAIMLALSKGRPNASWRHPMGAATAGFGASALCHQSSFLEPWAQVTASFVATVAILITSYNHLYGVSRQRVNRAALIGLAIVAMALIVGGFATIRAKSTLSTAAISTQQALDSARSGDLDDAITTFGQAQRSFSWGEKQLTDIWTLPARLVPVVGDNLSAGADAAGIGKDLTQSAVALGQDGDYQSLKLVDGALDLEAIARMTPGVQQARIDVDDAADRLHAIDRTWLLGPTQTQLDKMDEKLGGAQRDVVNAAELLTVVPKILGADGPTTWYVMFSQPAEARFEGGIAAEYAILQADHGHVENIQSGGTPELNTVPGERTLDMPEWYNDRYDRYHPKLYLQNHTASPDLPTNTQVAAQVVPQVGLPHVDGVIYVDPTGLAALLELTGPVTVAGIDEPLTAQNAERWLYIDQYADLVIRDQRNELLHEAGNAAFDALLHGESPGPGDAGRILGPAVAGGHIGVSAVDPTVNGVLDRLGISGRFAPPSTGDWVSVRYADSDGSKLDVYLQRDLEYSATVSEDGTLHATATLTLRNNVPDNLPDYVTYSATGLTGAAIPLQLSLYSPQVVKSVTVDGQPAKVGALREPWANTFTMPVLIPRGESRVVVFELEGVLLGNVHAITVIPQPAMTPMSARVTMTGSGAAVTGRSDGIEQPTTFRP